LRAPLVGVDVGPLPEQTLTFGAAAGWRFEAFEATLGARRGSSQTIWIDGMPGYGAEVARTTAELRACYAFRSNAFRAGPCLLMAVDWLTVSGLGDQVRSKTSHAPAFAAGAGAVGSIFLGDSWALIALVGVQTQLSRARVVVGGLGDVTQLSQFAFSASTAVEWSP
jgi:hypothetical protein